MKFEWLSDYESSLFFLHSKKKRKKKRAPNLHYLKEQSVCIIEINKTRKKNHKKGKKNSKNAPQL